MLQSIAAAVRLSQRPSGAVDRRPSEEPHLRAPGAGRKERDWGFSGFWVCQVCHKTLPIGSQSGLTGDFQVCHKSLFLAKFLAVFWHT